MASCKNMSYPERLRKLGLTSFEYRRERADLIQVYKILNDIDIVEKDKLFTSAQFTATRGHSFKLHKKDQGSTSVQILLVTALSILGTIFLIL